MDRPTFMGSGPIAVALFSVLSLAMPALAWAQQPAKPPKVAVLSPRAPTAQTCGANMQGSALPCFMDALHELGYVDGKNVSVELRFAEDDYKKLPALAAELVRLRPDVILTAGAGAIAAANATTTIPIIVGPASEETLTRLAGNLAHPTRNVTGFTLNSVEQEIKCLQLLRELAPRASRVALLLNPDNPGYGVNAGRLEPAATQLGLTLIRIEARNVSDLPQAFAAIVASGANAIFIADDAALAGMGPVRKQVSEWALKQRLSVVSPNARVASDGGLLSFGTDFNALQRRAAGYVDKILKGAKPADLPVERPSTFKLSVNVTTAKALGLTIPQIAAAARRRGDSVMDRRTFIGRTVGGLLAMPLGARAQNSSIPVIGFVSGQSPGPWAPYVAAFRNGLSETGYVEGKNVKIEYRWAEGRYDRVPGLVAELVRRPVAVVVAAGGGSHEAKAARRRSRSCLRLATILSRLG